MCHVQTYAQGNLPSPYSTVDGKVSISQFKTMDQPDTAEGIFLNALLYVVSHQERDEDGNLPTMEVDYDKHKFVTNAVFTNPKTSSVYKCVFSVLVSDNIITTMMSSISYESEVAVVKLAKHLAFEKLRIDKKPQHKQYLTEFASLTENYIDELVAYITSNTPPTVTHYQEIKNGRVVKGMTEAECLMSVGNPVTVYNEGEKYHWIYDSYTHIFIKDGIVVSVIN